MDRKAWIAIILSVIGLLGSQWYYIKQQQEWKAKQPAAKPAITSTDPAKGTPMPSGTPAVPASAEAPGSPVSVPDQTLPVETRTLRTAVAQYTFTSAGGIQKIELLQHKAENNQNVVINGTSVIPAGAWTEDTSSWTVPGRFSDVTEQSLAIESTTADGLLVRRVFKVGAGDPLKDEFQIRMDLEIRNPGQTRREVRPWFVATGAASPIHLSDQAHYTGLDYQLQSKTVHENVMGAFEPSRVPLLGIQFSPGQAEIRKDEKGVLWVATKNQYYTTILKPLGTDQGAAVWSGRYALPPSGTSTDKHYGIMGGLGFPGFALAPGETRSMAFAIYSGPKEYSRLKKLGTEQHEVMEFGFFKFFSEVLLNAMNWLHSIFKSYAAAIIVLTLIIKSGLWTIQNKSMQSMKKMALLGPKMTELKEKYKDDPTRMNQEVMKLYKDYGINPFSGCVPILIQMPIFFGFYAMLAVAVELRNSSFLWVNDLSQPDTIARIAGFPINLLPIVMAASMVWQMQLTPKSGDVAQQRIFMFMPVIFLVFSYNYASALALYWTVQNIFSIVQLYLTRNQPLPTLEKVVVTAPRKAK